MGVTGAPDFRPEVPECRLPYCIDMSVGAGLLDKRKEMEPHTPPTWRLTAQGHDGLEERSDCKGG